MSPEELDLAAPHWQPLLPIGDGGGDGSVFLVIVTCCLQVENNGVSVSTMRLVI